MRVKCQRRHKSQHSTLWAGGVKQRGASKLAKNAKASPVWLVCQTFVSAKLHTHITIFLSDVQGFSIRIVALIKPHHSSVIDSIVTGPDDPTQRWTLSSNDGVVSEIVSHVLTHVRFKSYKRLKHGCDFKLKIHWSDIINCITPTEPMWLIDSFLWVLLRVFDRQV